MEMREYRKLTDDLAAALTPEERRLLGVGDDGEAAGAAARAAQEGALMEDAMAASQNLEPQRRSQDRKDLRPWEGKHADGEIMFNFESAMDAQDVYDFVLESHLLVPGEVRIHLSGTQASVHLAPHVLVTRPDVVQAVLLAYEDQLAAGDEEAYEDVAMATARAIEERAERKVSKRGSAEPKAKRTDVVDFNPFHDPSGTFVGRDDLADGGSWSDGKKRRLKATTKKGKDGPKLHFTGTKRPCGREARERGGNIRCWDGKVISSPAAKKIVKTLGKKRRGGDRPMPEGWDAGDLRALREVREMYGIAD